jgi:rhodanese-related sulfurtransferase
MTDDNGLLERAVTVSAHSRATSVRAPGTDMSRLGMSGVDRMLAAARERIDRYAPAQAAAMADAVLVDLRGGVARRRDGIIPGSVHVRRSVLEWRADQDSGWANPYLADRPLILCEHGYSSSLAAASLRELGVDAGDLEGGFEAWAAAGLPVAPARPDADTLPGMGGPQ